MNGSQINPTEREKILAAMQTPPSKGYFIWDGQDEDERPLSREEMIAGMMQKAKCNDSQVLLQLDNEVLAYFYSTGAMWQKHLNNALKEWMREHQVVI